MNSSTKVIFKVTANQPHVSNVPEIINNQVFDSQQGVDYYCDENNLLSRKREEEHNTKDSTNTRTGENKLNTQLKNGKKIESLHPTDKYNVFVNNTTNINASKFYKFIVYLVKSVRYDEIRKKIFSPMNYNNFIKIQEKLNANNNLNLDKNTITSLPVFIREKYGKELFSEIDKKSFAEIYVEELKPLKSEKCLKETDSCEEKPCVIHGINDLCWAHKDREEEVEINKRVLDESVNKIIKNTHLDENI